MVEIEDIDKKFFDTPFINYCINGVGVQRMAFIETYIKWHDYPFILRFNFSKHCNCDCTQTYNIWLE